MDTLPLEAALGNNGYVVSVVAVAMMLNLCWSIFDVAAAVVVLQTTNGDVVDCCFDYFGDDIDVAVAVGGVVNDSWKVNDDG